MSRTNLAWLLVILGGIVEVCWVAGLKHADSLFLYTLTILGVMFSFSAMIMACKSIEVSVAYSVFVGIGAGGVVLGEMMFFNEPVSMIKISLIALLMVGVVGLKFTSNEQDEKTVKTLSKDLGIDEIEEDLNELGGGKI
ncbi:DMT family transporter [Campylobacter californiensis]|uniref:DMT family transporter n=1 Tax=Campylobacter californiensis TaxID=1032243 RepID=UPI0014748BB2|nr:multidrug efflux SMR transporter [Campylobacter sp. RM12916]MBE3610624.1 multidrug efflux SMR transporter [Campylobacter sp. RM12916]